MVSLPKLTLKKVWFKKKLHSAIISWQSLNIYQWTKYQPEKNVGP